MRPARARGSASLPSDKASARAALILALILASALALRLQGLDWGLPWAFHPDEIFYVDQALDILRFGDPNPKYFKNPSLLTDLVALGLLIGRALGPLAAPFTSVDLGGPYLTARLISALAGSVTVYLVYRLARELATSCRSSSPSGRLRGGGISPPTPGGDDVVSRAPGRGDPAPTDHPGTSVGARPSSAGLAAGAFLAFASLHVRDSHYGVNDVLATTLLTGSLLASLALLRQPTWRAYAAAGLLGGLATSAKYNMGLFLAPIVVAHLLARRPARITPLAFRELRLLILAGLSSLIGYLAATPYTLLDWPRFQRDFLVQYGFGNSRWLGQPLEPVPLLYLTSLLQGFGGIPLLLALLGIVFALRQRVTRPAALVLLAFPAVYLAFLMPRLLFFPRFTIPLLPILAALAGYGALCLAAWLGSRRSTGLAFPVILAVALLQPLWNVAHQARVLAATDTRILANLWAQEHLPPRSRIKIEDYSLFDLASRQRTHIENAKELRIVRFEGDPEADTARYFADRGYQYLVTSSFAYERHLVDPTANPETTLRYQRLHRSLDQRAELLAEFAPGLGNTPVPFRLDDLMTPFWEIERYERTGPTVRVYALR